MNSLETQNGFGQAVLTLQEALITCVAEGTESEPFHLKLPNSVKRAGPSEDDKSSHKVVRLRTTQVNIDGKKKIIVIIRDLTDSIEVGKI